MSAVLNPAERPRPFKLFGLWCTALVVALASTTALAETKVLSWVMTASSDDIKVYQELIRNFQAEHPSIRVDLVVAASAKEFDEKVQLLIASGDPPAVWYPAGANGPRYFAAQGLLMDIDPLLARHNVDLNDFNKASLDFARWQGKLRGLPANDNVNFYAYNKALFDESGIPYPPASWEEKSWTWDAFLNVAKKLTRFDATGKVTQYGVERVYDEWAVPWMFGGDWVPAEAHATGRPTRAAVTDPKAIQSLQFWADLARVHRVTPGTDGSGGLSFGNGRIAMTMADIGSFPTFARLGLDIGVAPMPRPSANVPATTILLPNQWVMFASQKYPEEAASFFLYLTSQEGMKTIWPARGYRLPGRRSLWPLWMDRARSVFGLSEKDIRTVLESYTYAKVRPSYTLLSFSRMAPLIGEQEGYLRSGQKSGRQAAEALKQAFEAIFSEESR